MTDHSMQRTNEKPTLEAALAHVANLFERKPDSRLLLVLATDGNEVIVESCAEVAQETKNPLAGSKGGLLAAVPCPRCGCHMTKHFVCNCTEAHDRSDYCVNCGRFTNLGTTEYVELGPTDARCFHGPIEHEHPFEEKGARIDAFADSLRRAQPAREAPDDELYPFSCENCGTGFDHHGTDCPECGGMIRMNMPRTAEGVRP